MNLQLKFSLSQNVAVNCASIHTYYNCLNMINFIPFTDLDMAIAYWNIVLSGRFKFLDLWCKFLQVSLFLFCFKKFITKLKNIYHSFKV